MIYIYIYMDLCWMFIPFLGQGDKVDCTMKAKRAPQDGTETLGPS